MKTLTNMAPPNKFGGIVSSDETKRKIKRKQDETKIKN